MSDFLVREAARRGKEEAERRDLQYKINAAYHAEVERVEGARREKAKKEELSRRRKERAAHLSRVFTCYAAQLGWMALCIYIAFNQAWQEFPTLDDFFWNKEWLAYIGTFIVFVYGRQFILKFFNTRSS